MKLICTEICCTHLEQVHNLGGLARSEANADQVELQNEQDEDQGDDRMISRLLAEPIVKQPPTLPLTDLEVGPQSTQLEELVSYFDALEEAIVMQSRRESRPELSYIKIQSFAWKAWLILLTFLIKCPIYVLLIKINESILGNQA